MAIYKEYGYDIQNGKAIIPEWETEIKEWAFRDCKELTSVELHQWIKKIGSFAFSDCSSLTSITVSKENKVYDSREDCNAIIHTESNTLIRGCMNTIIPPSVTKIGDCAFSGCSSLTEVRIPKGCNVHKSAFKDCPKVKIICY